MKKSMKYFSRSLLVICLLFSIVIIMPVNPYGESVDNGVSKYFINQNDEFLMLKMKRKIKSELFSKYNPASFYTFQHFRNLLIHNKNLGELEKKIPYIKGVSSATVEELKSFCASVATYGGTALFHMEGITPEYNSYPIPRDFFFDIEPADIKKTRAELIDTDIEIDFVSLGCPHASIHEIAQIIAAEDGLKIRVADLLN